MAIKYFKYKGNNTGELLFFIQLYFKDVDMIAGSDNQKLKIIINNTEEIIIPKYQDVLFLLFIDPPDKINKLSCWDKNGRIILGK